MSQEGFGFENAGKALLFWRMVRRYGLNTEKERVDLLRKMVAKKKSRYVRDIHPLVEGKKILRIKGKNDD